MQSRLEALLEGGRADINMCLNTWFHRVHQVWVRQILWYLGSHLHANLCYSSRNVEILKKKRKKKNSFPMNSL